MDAAIIASAQAVEHYEMTRYGALITWARELGRNDFADILGVNLEEEKAADRTLSALADRRLNALAQGRRPARTARANAVRRKKTKSKVA